MQEFYTDHNVMDLSKVRLVQKLLIGALAGFAFSQGDKTLQADQKESFSADKSRLTEPFEASEDKLLNGGDHN